MKKLIITCALIAVGTVVSFAQAKTAGPQNNNAATPSRGTAPTQEQAATQRATQYQKDLGLSDVQYQAVYHAQLDFIKQDQAMRANGAHPGTGQAEQNQMSLDQRMQNAMTPEQFAKYNKMATSPGKTK